MRIQNSVSMRIEYFSEIEMFEIKLLNMKALHNSLIQEYLFSFIVSSNKQARKQNPCKNQRQKNVLVKPSLSILMIKQHRLTSSATNLPSHYIFQIKSQPKKKEKYIYTELCSTINRHMFLPAGFHIYEVWGL